MPPPSRSRIPADPLRNAWFGDLHVHTSYSTDAFIFGVRALPDDAYHFAKGGTIAHGAGYPIRLSKPLDFLAITDHAEFLGTARAANPDIPSTRRPLRQILKNGNRLEYSRYWVESVAMLTSGTFGAFGANPTASRAAWEDTIASAERHDEPGVFTAFIGYEWSSIGIHRNVVYGSERAPDRPFSSIDSQRPQDLWRALEAQNDAGQSVIAIPHNMNESGGRMYPSESIEDLVWSESEAMRRRRIEPVSEIYQVKGSSEAHPELSPDDPFADFEIIDLPAYRGVGGGPKGAYSRDALRLGLELSMREGWNPYVLGVIGSTDSHNASSPVEEDRHHGKLPILDGSAAIRSAEALLIPASETPGATWGGGGLAGIWAEENTRASLFAALKRRETFATSGPRISVRFFGGWDFDPSTLTNPDLLSVAYREGVPMGGDLPAQTSGSPTFVLWADKDPSTAHLDRLQVIKGSLDKEGHSYERIYDVAASGDRARDEQTGLFESVGNSVDIPSASYTNTIGAAHLEAVWTDPDFDAGQDAFYYVRVLEIPTPRMSTYDAKTLGIDAPEPATIQERATTSAIWYSATR
ncbi:MAG: hypothetical protein CL933_24985 [Deltaproteobacteria bacterium]|nr:hypothetical protein [Deltaproteobacteria bacterium]